MPWTAEHSWKRVHQGTMIEDVCEENNGFFFGYDVAPIPHADKPDF